MRWLRVGLLLAGTLGAQALPDVKRVYIEGLGGGAAGEQMRSLLSAALHGSGRFVVTENEEKADAVVRGTADDVAWFDYSSANERADGKTSAGASLRDRTLSRVASSAVGDASESYSVRDRKREALGSIRLVNREGDVIWAATIESAGGKFRGPMADVADRLVKQLVDDMERAKSWKKGS